KTHLFRVGPDLTAGDLLDTAAQQSEMGILDAEDSASTGAEGVDHEFAVVGLNEQDFSDGGVGEMDTTHGRHLVGDIDRVIQRKDDDLRRAGGDSLEDRGDIDLAGGDAKVRAAAQSASE